jgi:hypothetical protein
MTAAQMYKIIMEATPKVEQGTPMEYAKAGSDLLSGLGMTAAQMYALIMSTKQPHVESYME